MAPLVVAVLIPILWLAPIPTQIGYYRVVDEETIALGFGVASPDQINLSRVVEDGQSIEFSMTAARPWFAGETEILYPAALGLRRVIDATTGEDVPRR